MFLLNKAIVTAKLMLPCHVYWLNEHINYLWMKWVYSYLKQFVCNYVFFVFDDTEFTKHANNHTYCKVGALQLHLEFCESVSFPFPKYYNHLIATMHNNKQRKPGCELNLYYNVSTMQAPFSKIYIISPLPLRQL